MTDEFGRNTSKPTHLTEYRLGTWDGEHRGHTFHNLVLRRDASVFDGWIDGYRMGICQVAFADSEKWWIIPINYSEEEIVSDIGPYDTMEEAILFMRLYSTCN